MSIVQCKNHHYYDSKRSDHCPYCSIKTPERVYPQEETQPLIPLENVNEDRVKTESLGVNVDARDKTVTIIDNDYLFSPVTGWLVCVDGAQKGKSYELHSGRNFAGRSVEMDIVLSDDPYITREKHFSIVYDPVGIRFYAVCGDGLTYINDKALTSKFILKDADRISAGRSQFVFVAFCKKGRVW